MKIEVVYSLWGADGVDEAFSGGVQGPEERRELANPSARLLRAIAGAEAAGAVRVVEATKEERSKLDRAIQSQEDGEKAQAKAQADVDEGGQIVGPWQHGNHVDFVAQRRALLDDPESGLTRDERAAIERDVADAEQRLSEMEAPS